jgi:hypothetical protein
VSRQKTWKHGSAVRNNSVKESNTGELINFVAFNYEGRKLMFQHISIATPA